MKSKLFLLPLLLLLAGCKKDGVQKLRVSELGAATNEYQVTAEAGTVSVKVLSNESYKISVINKDAWLQPAITELQGDGSFDVKYDANVGFPRMAKIALYAPGSNRYDTVVIKQHGAIDPQLSFAKTNTTVLGDGGQVSNTIKTNIPFNDIKIDLIYPDATVTGWVNNDYALNTSNSTFNFSVKSNPSQTGLRNAQVKLSYTDGWGDNISATLFLLQANALNQFGTKTDFPGVRVYAGDKITSDIFIEGYVVSDAGNKNIGDYVQTTSTAIDYTTSDKTVYIESTDGKYGFCLKTATAADNIFTRYSKVQVLLKGTSVTATSNPNAYTISGVTSNMVMSQEAGTAASLPLKQKAMSELTDDDIYTYVTLSNCEFPIRKGPLTPVNEGYTPLFNANRITKYPLLMRDNMGNSMFLLTNINCAYRRDGSMLPYGSGTVSGVIVHETFTRFEYQDAASEDDYGNIGRYQIRHVSRDDIKMNADFNNSFSALLTEYQYPNLSGGAALPTYGTNGRITASAAGVSISATSDYTYLGPVGSTNLGNTNLYGNGVLINGAKQNTSTSTNSDGKGAAAGSALNTTCNWWNNEKNRGEAWIVEVSTAGINTTQLSMQFTALNWASNGGGTPRFWKVQWSDSNDMDGTWNDIAAYTVPDASNYANTLNHQLPGYKNINIPLPLAILGKSKVYIRLIVDKNLCSTGATYASAPITQAMGSAIGYLAIRYNK